MQHKAISKVLVQIGRCLCMLWKIIFTGVCACCEELIKDSQVLKHLCCGENIIQYPKWKLYRCCIIIPREEKCLQSAEL